MRRRQRSLPSRDSAPSGAFAEAYRECVTLYDYDQIKQATREGPEDGLALARC